MVKLNKNAALKNLILRPRYNLFACFRLKLNELILSLPKLISNRSCLPYNTILLESFANSRPWLETNRSWIILWYIKQLHRNYFSAKQWHKLWYWIMTFFVQPNFTAQWLQLFWTLLCIQVQRWGHG